MPPSIAAVFLAPLLSTVLLSGSLLSGPLIEGSLFGNPLIGNPLIGGAGVAAAGEEPAGLAGVAGRATPAGQATPAGIGAGGAGPKRTESAPHPRSPSSQQARSPELRSPELRLSWPLAGTPHLVRPFEPPSHEYGPGHRGADLAGPREQSALSAGDGVVVYAGRLIDRDLVSVEHAGGLRTTYEPILPTVTAGQHVAAGQPIGTLQDGHPGCRAAPPGTCLHWGARREDRYLDPTLLIGGRLRLLPWDGAPSG